MIHITVESTEKSVDLAGKEISRIAVIGKDGTELAAFGGVGYVGAVGSTSDGEQTTVYSFVTPSDLADRLAHLEKTQAEQDDVIEELLLREEDEE